MTQKVLYIGGFGRRGSTLVERILGQLPAVDQLLQDLGSAFAFGRGDRGRGEAGGKQAGREGRARQIHVGSRQAAGRPFH